MDILLFEKDEFPIKLKIDSCIGYCMQCCLYDENEKCTDKIKRLIEENICKDK